MSKKLNKIPIIPNYNWIREQMKSDFDYRMESRMIKTSLGRPLYERINVQLITTHECPYNCPFCLERQNPMEGQQNFNEQIKALRTVLLEHPNARLSITGGEPSLYVEHISNIVSTFKKYSNNIFVSINTAGYNEAIKDIAHLNLSVNTFVKPNLLLFPNSTYQTVFKDGDMTIENIKDTINNVKAESENGISEFSFRFLSGLEKHDYPINIWDELENEHNFQVNTFRVGDFFVYATFNYKDVHGRITLGDMNQQQKNNYLDGYSNIIIHPDGTIKTNWK